MRTLILVGLFGLVLVGRTAAGERRYHLVPDVPGNVSMKPVPGYGPQSPPPRPTCQVNYRHPYTGRPVTVPLQLPEDTPRIYYRMNRVVYDYGSDTVSVVFLPDGTVDVIYNSGFLRAP